MGKDNVIVKGKYRWGLRTGINGNDITVECVDNETHGGSTSRASISPVDAEALAGILVEQAKQVREEARKKMTAGTTVWYRGVVECIIAHQFSNGRWFLIDKVDSQVVHSWSGEAQDLLADAQYQLFKGG